ncbi:hypothetical protein N0V82_001853 [Gnomoniopsis sp. IMI 355080]|nr:hypothetical protein N0V82_001853 [Gnomoniopsis sp. IMI 355080]
MDGLETDQLVSFPFPLSEDTPSLHFTGSSSLPSTTVNAKDTTILPFIPAGRGERLPTNEIEDMVTSHSSTPNVEPSLVLLLRTELATTRALLASSKDANLALQERIKQLESSSSAELPRTKLPRDRLGRFVTKTTSVQKVQRLPLGTKTNSSRACRRTQNAMLVEAAIEYGYVNVPKGRIAVPGKLAVKENSVELYARESRDGEERENREKLWARSWCEDVHKRRVTKIQGMTERDQAGI